MLHLAGCTTNPTGAWVTQQARNLSFTGLFERMVALLTPASTNANPRPRAGQIERRDRLGGLIHKYHRAAA